LRLLVPAQDVLTAAGLQQKPSLAGVDVDVDESTTAQLLTLAADIMVDAAAPPPGDTINDDDGLL